MRDDPLDFPGGPKADISPTGHAVEGRGGASDFRFTLYICGATEKSQKAVADARRLCDEYLGGRYALEIVDLYRQAELAQSKDILATPTLVLEYPGPPRRFVGDLSGNERLVVHMTPGNRADQ